MHLDENTEAMLDLYGEQREYARLCLSEDHGVREPDLQHAILGTARVKAADSEDVVRAKVSRAVRRWLAREG